MNSKQRCSLRKRLRAKGFDDEYIEQVIKQKVLEADTATAIAGERTEEVLFPERAKGKHNAKKQIRRRKGHITK
ncbi:hypothetical protein [Enterovibrio nigricans]|uniref:Uncharacterized protein n=1 Tax=Enterovibrio nigricans DSM 22720 TaxID=1121868 RepID=A0A1T4V633_9GAMM|nr:hypothetical protein [Enterovibrio nigricans]PKF49397.1 hypothetical protein AT251_19200 [Enterovibrio nigricans]SKA60376.1 hypothetical protein SAMN02745132_03296 [Enterovibrio nigricans DSM 22720]